MMRYGTIWKENQIEALLNKVFQEYNIDKNNVFILGHSLGANNAVYLAKRMPETFSKALIFSSGLAEYPTIPIKWYFGTMEIDYYINAARRYESHYGKDAVCWLEGVYHPTPTPAYNKDDGTFLGIANNNCSDMVEWLLEDVVLKPVITGISLHKTELNLTVGKETTLTVLAQPTTADISGQTITWESANTSVAKVDKNGLVTAVGAGTTQITATLLGYSAVCNVTVAEPLKVNLSETEIIIPSEQKKQLKITSNESLDNKTIRWNSSNEAVAKVDENGLITAIGEGMADITVTVKKQNTDGDVVLVRETCRVIVSGMLADVDKDKKITAYDAYKALETSVDYLINQEIEEQIVLIVDVSKNGIPEAEDAYKILKYSVGLIDKF